MVYKNYILIQCRTDWSQERYHRAGGSRLRRWHSSWDLHMSDNQLKSNRFWTWKSLVWAASGLIHILTPLNVAQTASTGWHHCQRVGSVIELQQSQDFVKRLWLQRKRKNYHNDIVLRELVCLILLQPPSQTPRKAVHSQSQWDAWLAWSSKMLPAAKSVTCYKLNAG